MNPREALHQQLPRNSESSLVMSVFEWYLPCYQMQVSSTNALDISEGDHLKPLQVKSQWAEWQQSCSLALEVRFTVSSMLHQDSFRGGHVGREKSVTYFLYSILSAPSPRYG